MTDCVRLRLRGRMPEKFISHAVVSGVCIRKAARVAPGEMMIEAGSAHAERLLELAREYRIDLAVVQRQGWRAILSSVKARIGLLLGLLLGCVLIVAFTSRIWRVTALSLDGSIDSQQLRAIEQTAAELGASPGRLRASIDRELLALELQARWPELVHVGVRLVGVTLQVEAAAEQAAPQVYDISHGCDLVSMYDAVIVHVDALAGKAAVRAGDTVRRGQVLIRGEERVNADGVRPVRALGSVIGRMWTQAECSLPLYRTVRRRTGRMNVSSAVRLGEWTLPFSDGWDYAHQERQSELMPIGGLYLPVRIERVTRWETIEEQTPEDINRLTAQGEAWALELAREKLPDGARETGCWFDTSQENGMLLVRATIEAQMDIAAEGVRPDDGVNE